MIFSELPDMKIEWQLTGNDPDDLKAVVGDDMLRVERLSRYWWWWAIYIGIGGEATYDCWMYGSAATSCGDAKLKAENKYNEIRNRV